MNAQVAGKRVRQRPGAAADIAAIADTLREAQTPDVAVRFLDSVQACYARLAREPASGAVLATQALPELPTPLRAMSPQSFPTVRIYYLDTPDAVDVLRVHDAQPGGALADDAP